MDISPSRGGEQLNRAVLTLRAVPSPGAVRLDIDVVAWAR